MISGRNRITLLLRFLVEMTVEFTTDSTGIFSWSISMVRSGGVVMNAVDFETVELAKCDFDVDVIVFSSILCDEWLSPIAVGGCETGELMINGWCDVTKRKKIMICKFKSSHEFYYYCLTFWCCYFKQNVLSSTEIAGPNKNEIQTKAKCSSTFGFFPFGW